MRLFPFSGETRILLILRLAFVSWSGNAEVALGAGSPSDPTTPAATQTDVIARDEDSAVYRTLSSNPGPDGSLIVTTNQFTLVESGLHYLDNGEWRESEDLIEVLPEGVVAQRGPQKAIFSPELNTDVVFDIETADGQRVRGGVRAIQLRNLKSEETRLLGELRPSVRGQLLPPNRIPYADAFVGLAADVLLIWKHNSFAQDVVLRARPKLPADWESRYVRLEVVTEFMTDHEPELRSQTVPDPDGLPLVDDTIIQFGRLALLVGKAFPVAGDRAVSLGAGNLNEDGAPVLKRWQRTPDGRPLGRRLPGENFPVHQWKLPESPTSQRA